MEGHTSSMTAERWMQLKQIFEAAQGKPASEQAEIVRVLAQGDEELRLAAQDLLAADQSAGSFLQTPPAQLQNPLLAPGAKLGPYQILGLLGEGGMGKVYRGLDTRLTRLFAHRQQRHIARPVEHIARAGLQLRGHVVERLDDLFGQGATVHARS